MSNINRYLLEWRSRLDITPDAAAEFLGLSEFRYSLYEYFNICPKAIKIACIYIELLHISARQYSDHLKIKYPYKPYHRLAEDILIDGLIDGVNPTDDPISVLLQPKQSIKYVIDKKTPDKKQISNKKQTFKYSEWKTRLELHGEDVVDFLSISEDEELAYANGQELPPLVLIACRFLERCHLLALDQLENVIIKQKGEPFIKAHYPTLAVANGAFQQYALSYFYNEQRYYKKNLKRLFHTLSGVEKEYRKEYKKRSAT